MKIYHYHPHNLIFIKIDNNNYMETLENFALDYGQAGYLPVNPYNEIIYDLDDSANRFAINTSSGLKDIIPEINLEIENIINAYDDLLAAQALRNIPSLSLEEQRQSKIITIKNEGLRRIQLRIPGVSSFDQLDLIKEQWLSITPAARTPTIDFQYVIDIWQAGKDAIINVNSFITITNIIAYDEINTPTWPV